MKGSGFKVHPDASRLGGREDFGFTVEGVLSYYHIS